MFLESSFWPESIIQASWNARAALQKHDQKIEATKNKAKKKKKKKKKSDFSKYCGLSNFVKKIKSSYQRQNPVNL